MAEDIKQAEFVYSEFYDGQGLGNQLWTYANVRALAFRNGLKFSILSANRFKGKHFLDLNFGEFAQKTLGHKPNENTLFNDDQVFFEKKEICRRGHFDISKPLHLSTEPNFNVKIEGNFESESNIDCVKEELLNVFQAKCDPLTPKSEDTCIINFRGYDFQYHANLALNRVYFDRAMKAQQDIVGKRMEFKVITDDVVTARKIFPDLEILSSMGEFSNSSGYPARKVAQDLATLQHGKYLILSNSSFSWWGAWTNRSTEVVIAPKYWARPYSRYKLWSPEGVITKNWIYLDQSGQIQSAQDCKREVKKIGYRIKRVLLAKSAGEWWMS